MIWWAVAGIFSGVLAGMGLGGGALLIPLLALLGVQQSAAQMLNLIAFLPGATVALIIHGRAGRLWKPALVRVLLPGLPGAALGAWLSTVIQVDLLRRGFGVFLIALGILQWIGAGKAGNTGETDTKN